MRSAEPTAPGPDVSKGTGLVAGTTVLQGISLTLVAMRIYSRAIPISHLWWDDYFIVAAIIFALANWTLTCISVSHGLGRHNYYLSPDERVQAEKFIFISQPPFAWALTCAKISIALLLIRILQGNRLWKFFLYGVVIVQFLIGITMNTFQLMLCKPLAAIWDKTIPNYVCIQEVVQTSIYITAILTILTDVILSLLPLTFIKHVWTSLRERIVIIFIMGLGLVASCASIYKMTLVNGYQVADDTLFCIVGLSFWSILEVQLAIIAACIPCLKQLFERTLNCLGLISTATPECNRQGYVNHEDSSKTPIRELSVIRSVEAMAPAVAFDNGSRRNSEEIVLSQGLYWQ